MADPDRGNRLEIPEAARAVYEAVRRIINATPALGLGLVEPADVRATLSYLELAADRIPQALGQLTRWLDREVTAQRLRSAGGVTGDAPGAVLDAEAALQRAGLLAQQLAVELSRAQLLLRGLSAHETPEVVLRVV